jgi:protocatechuate 3,4-dioxygenase beta subunit
MRKNQQEKNAVNKARRKVVLGIATLPVTGIVSAAVSTPGATEGPFYPTVAMRYDDIDNDLVKVSSEVKQAGGEIVLLKGRVLDQQGQPVKSVRVEIWQCDVNGRYLHRGDYDQKRNDKAFQGFGHEITNAQGEYSFRTIKPVPYSGRTPHIHLKIWAGGQDILTTQLYLPDHPGNARDWLYRHVPKDKRELVTMHFKNTGKEPVANVDLVV